MFPDPYVPRSYVPRFSNSMVLCSRVSMFPIRPTYGSWSQCSPVLCSPILSLNFTVLCSTVSMFPSRPTYVPRAHIYPDGRPIYFPYFIISLICTFVVSNFCYFVPSLFKMFKMIVVAAIFGIDKLAKSQCCAARFVKDYSRYRRADTDIITSRDQITS